MASQNDIRRRVRRRIDLDHDPRSWCFNACIYAGMLRYFARLWTAEDCGKSPMVYRRLDRRLDGDSTAHIWRGWCKLRNVVLVSILLAPILLSDRKYRKKGGDKIQSMQFTQCLRIRYAHRYSWPR